MSQRLQDGVDGQTVVDLANKFLEFSEGVDHRVVLNALLLSYIGVAQAHHCCTAAALGALAEAAVNIAEDAADPQTNYPATTVH